MNQPDRANEARAVVVFLEKLRDDPRNGSAAMAIFRRGLSERAADLEKMQRYLHRFMRESDAPHERWHERSVFLIASLFALYKNAPTPNHEDNMGNHFADARDKATSPEAVERRFSALISAHHEDLPVYLRRAVTFLKSQEKGIGINWAQLLQDVWNWQHPTRGEDTRRAWSRRFWLQKREDAPDQQTASTNI